MRTKAYKSTPWKEVINLLFVQFCIKLLIFFFYLIDINILQIKNQLSHKNSKAYKNTPWIKENFDTNSTKFTE